MNKSSMKRNKIFGNFVNILFCIIVPCFFMIWFGVRPYFDEDKISIFALYGILFPMLSFYAVYIFSIIFHELGHLLFGIVNKFNFMEFKFLIFVIFRENGILKVKIKKSLKGMGGYCLMNFPDDLSFKKFKPFAFGGIVFNLGLVICSLFLLVFMKLSVAGRLVLLYTISINFGMALSNIIPYELNGFETDGSKIYKMKYDLNYINNFNKLYKASRLIKDGITIDKIPDELIYKPKEINYQSDLDAMNLYISKLLYLKNYNEAEELINMCLNSEVILPNTINSLKINLIDLYLYTNRFNRIKEIYDEDLFKFVSNFLIDNKGLFLYMIIWYILKNDLQNINKSNNEFLKYLSTLDKESSVYIEFDNLYNSLKSIQEF